MLVKRSNADYDTVWVMQPGGTPGFTIPLTQTLTFSPDNTYDIGASGANRPRNVIAGTAVLTPMVGNPQIGGLLSFQTGGATRWQIDTSQGNLIAGADNTYDIGANGAYRPRNVYVANNLSFSPTGQVVFRDSTNSYDIVAVGRPIDTTIRLGGGNQNYVEIYGHVTPVARFDNGGNTSLAGALGWSPAGGFAADTYLVRDAANTLAQRNGTNAQTLRLYNTYTDASNYERLMVGWEGTNYAYLRAENAGTGQARDLVIVSGANKNIYFQIGQSQNYWRFDGPSKAFLAATDNAYDIGASGANRPRNIYAAGPIQGAYFVSNAGYTDLASGVALKLGNGVPAAGLGNNGDVYFNQAGAAGTTIYQKRAGAWVGIV